MLSTWSVPLSFYYTLGLGYLFSWDEPGSYREKYADWDIEQYEEHYERGQGANEYDPQRYRPHEHYERRQQENRW
jgi:hypothetical protein